MAPRRWCRNRIRSVGCLSAASSDASRFRCQRRVQSVRSADRHHRGRLLLVTSLGDAREVTRLPGRAPACPSGRAHFLSHPPGRRGNLALRLRTSKTTTRNGYGQPPSIRPAAYSGQASIRPAAYSGRTDDGESVRLYDNDNDNGNGNDNCRCAGNRNRNRDRTATVAARASRRYNDDPHVDPDSRHDGRMA
jgi:hypothetical protein